MNEKGTPLKSCADTALISSSKLPLVYISDYTYYLNKALFPASHAKSGGNL